MSELSVDVKLNEQQAVASAKKLAASFEDTATDMEKLAKAGDTLGKSTDDIARDLKNAGDDRPFDEIRRDVEKADDALDDMGDEADDTRRALDKVSDAGDDIGDKVNRGTDKAKAGLEDFKSESQQTARESAASFDGSAQSIGDAFQEVAANAFSGFGPAGLLAGVAAAAGIGTVIAAFEGINEQNELSKERVADWANAFIDAGSTILTAGIQAANYTKILTDPEAYAEAEKNATNWGVAVDTAIQAMSGNAGAIEDVNTSLRNQKDAAAEAATEAQRLAQESGGQLTTLTQQEQAYLAGADALARLTGEMEAGQSRARMLSEYYVGLINSAAGATVEVDELGNSLYTLPEGEQILIDAQTGQASMNVNGFKGDVDGIPDSVTTTVSVRADTSGLYSFNQALEAARRNAERGITVNTRNVGVQWQ